MREYTVEKRSDKIVVIGRDENGFVSIYQDFNNNTGEPFQNEEEANIYISEITALSTPQE